VKALIDSGATKSFVNPQVFDQEVQTELESVREGAGVKRVESSIIGSTATVESKCLVMEVEMALGEWRGFHEVVISDAITDSMVLGRDFLKKASCLVDHASDTLTIKAPTSAKRIPRSAANFNSFSSKSIRIETKGDEQVEKAAERPSRPCKEASNWSDSAGVVDKVCDKEQQTDAAKREPKRAANTSGQVATLDSASGKANRDVARESVFEAVKAGGSKEREKAFQRAGRLKKSLELSKPEAIGPKLDVPARKKRKRASNKLVESHQAAFLVSREVSKSYEAVKWSQVGAKWSASKGVSASTRVTQSSVYGG
jgi:hypothetical protein